MIRCIFTAAVLGIGAQYTASQSPPVAPADDVPFAKTVQVYRSGPIAENVQVRVRDDRGRERRSDVLVKIDASETSENGPLKARVELGDLAISLEGHKMLATHRLEKNRYAEFTLSDGPLLESLTTVMPALVLPQLALADPGTDRLEDLGVLPGRTAVVWQPGAVDRPTGKMMYAGTAGDTTFRLLVDRNSGRISSLQVASASGPIRNIDLTARSLPAGDSQTWPIEIVGRQRVDALADLIAEADQVRVGERFPATMTLMSTGLSPWTEVKDNLISVLIFVPTDPSGLEDYDSQVRDEVMRRLQRETRIAAQLVRKLEAGSKDRWIARSVAIIPPDAVRLSITSILLSLLNPTDSAVLSIPDNMPLIAVGQVFDYDSIIGGGTGGAVVLDKDRIVRAIITVGEVEPTEKKIREALDALK
ncbi:MAG: hypothetical protein KF691_07820 [Phycisphaeraceae bacterium]|nr:hypothetical protein [Phycisphaeraceae bacterium]